MMILYNEARLVNVVCIVFEQGDEMLTLSSMEDLIVECSQHGDHLDLPYQWILYIKCNGVRVSVMFHFMFVHYIFRSVWVAE